ncbi:cupin-like domain-containing protein [Caenimonas aquaedulcis]|uniref:Cupin-like domain-containing protein n=1 Tax=Caenimonas aquaedulcis TaxID=2793270 RepID=A0A931H629_9BURK|nr:cupin-like domain-containing protein [Caenimonas aquaedulcis]MBG9389085.1 cupin-like domain-containing protein [Caenimonas aquaedulcis]
MKRVAIERRSGMDPAEFTRHCLADGGRPVIVTDAMNEWAALRQWTLPYFLDRYGSDLVPVSLGLSSSVAKMTKLSAFIGHLLQPGSELPGFWIDSASGKPLRTDPEVGRASFYLIDWYAFEKHPELFEAISPPAYFVADWERALGAPLREAVRWVSGRETTSLYVGAGGALSPLHRDFWNTHATLAQILGRKRVMLFSPADTPAMYEGRVDPEQPDLAAFPLLHEATMHEAVIGPGDMLFIPAGWWHCVRALDNAVTVSHNFFNETNFGDHLAGLLRGLPRLAEGLQRNPQWKLGP